MTKAWLSIAAAVACNVAAAQQYLCVASNVVGFSMNKSTKTWGATTFEPTTKLVIGPPTAGDKVLLRDRGVPALVVRELGKGTVPPRYACGQPANEYGMVFCDGFGGSLTLNVKAGRFISNYMVGYAQVNSEGQLDSGEDTPVITIGTCSAF